MVFEPNRRLDVLLLVLQKKYAFQMILMVLYAFSHLLRFGNDPKRNWNSFMSSFLRGKFSTSSVRSHQRTRARGLGGGGGGEQGGGGGVYGGGSSSLSPVSSGVAKIAGDLGDTAVATVVAVVVVAGDGDGDVVAVALAGSSKIG